MHKWLNMEIPLDKTAQAKAYVAWAISAGLLNSPYYKGLYVKLNYR